VTVPHSYFDKMYAAAADPWGFGERWYERRKYALTVASLPEQRYASAYEPGCSIGVLSGLLAQRCESLLCTDGSAAAVDRARLRLAASPGITVEQRWLPDEWPAGRFDLVVLSELLYYFDAAALPAVLERALSSLTAGGTLLAAHWRHPVPDYPMTGDQVHARLAEAAAGRGAIRVSEHAEDDFLLDVWLLPVPGRAADRSSVAARTGLV
jgi:SAM-dependent methyltransferase